MQSGCPTGDLTRVMQYISSLNHYDSYVLRMENAIQQMCDELQAAIKASWWGVLPNADRTTIEQIYSNSQQRTRSRVGTGGGSGLSAQPRASSSRSSKSASTSATAVTATTTTTTTTSVPSPKPTAHVQPPPPSQREFEFVVDDD
jgi:hypothetical protein